MRMGLIQSGEAHSHCNIVIPFWPWCLIEGDSETNGGESGQDVAGVADGQLEHWWFPFLILVAYPMPVA